MTDFWWSLAIMLFALAGVGVHVWRYRLDGRETELGLALGLLLLAAVYGGLAWYYLHGLPVRPLRHYLRGAILAMALSSAVASYADTRMLDHHDN